VSCTGAGDGDGDAADDDNRRRVFAMDDDCGEGDEEGEEVNQKKRNAG